MADAKIRPHKPAYRPNKRWRKKNKTHASEFDLEFEAAVLAIVRRGFPGLPIVTEEQHPRIPDADMFLSLDPVDGTAYQGAGFDDWAISLGVIKHGRPYGGFVHQPAKRIAFAGLKDTGIGLKGSGVQHYDFERKIDWQDFHPKKPRYPLVGSDFGPKSPDEYWNQVKRYVRKAQKQPKNLPAVAGGIETLMGKIDGWWSYTAHHWDDAAIAFLIEAMGGVIERLEDGGEISWTSGTQLPPILVAGSRQLADRIRLLIAPPEANAAKKLLLQLPETGPKTQLMVKE